MKNERLLIRQMKQGNHRAMEKWITHYYPVVYRFIFYKCHDDHLCEDLCQEVFLSFIKDLPIYHFQEKSLNYLFRVASHRFIDAKRKQKREDYLDFDDEIYEDEMNPTVEEVVASKIEKEKLIHYISGLQPPYLQDVIILYYFEDYTFKEISETLDVPVSTIKSRHNKALQLLRKEIELHEN